MLIGGTKTTMILNKKKNYDQQYYNEHKQVLLNARKIKYHSDKEYREQVKQQSKQIKQP